MSIRSLLARWALVLVPGAVLAAPPDTAWTAAQKTTLASLSLARLPAAPADPSNAYADRADAAALGRRLFADTRLSRNGQVACATCHDPARGFQDGRAVGQGVGTGTRRTMPIAGSAHLPWLFWDGRKDSLWSQALGPLEDAAEHGMDRVTLARLLQTHYRADYEAVFGRLPSLQGLPAEAGPLGTPAQREAWQRLGDAQRDAVNRVFANLGKAIAAHERTLRPAASRFDRYVAAVLADDRAGQQVLTAAEQRGLRLFVGPGQCATCHNGPLLSDGQFHNTGVPPRDAARPDPGRSAAIARVQADEFNCLGRYSDAPPDGCQELRFIADGDAALRGAFKTPGLRDVAGRAPYGHAGQFAGLEDAVAHYTRAPAAAIGRSELAAASTGPQGRAPIRLSPGELADLVAFLGSLGGDPAPERQAMRLVSGDAATDEPGIRANSTEALKGFALAGLGILRAPHFVVADELASGRLVRLFDDEPLGEYVVSVVFPDRTTMPTRLRRLIDHLARGLASLSPAAGELAGPGRAELTPLRPARVR